MIVAALRPHAWAPTAVEPYNLQQWRR